VTDSNLSAIQLVVDRSGSMSNIYSDAEGAINNFIEKQREEPGRCLIRITEFDNLIETPVELTDINKIDKYTLAPRGMTALFDAMGTAIVELGAKLSELPEDKRPAHVIFVTITDGIENASSDYDADRIKELIGEQESKYSWTFLFLAAGQDAVLTGAKMGIRPNMAMSYAATGEGYRSTFDSANYAASSLRSGITFDGFTDEDRRKAGGHT
jgi:uncharacterized protein YegL